MSEESNKNLKAQLQKMLDNNHVVHAFLFVGGNKETREELGFWLLEKILCKDDIQRQKFIHGNCEDFIIVEKPEDRESIVKEQILELISKLEYKPFGDEYGVLIKDASLMRPEAQNKLLKTLEEPVSKTVFILLAETKETILSTIQSRCMILHLEDEKEIFPDDISKIAEEYTKAILCEQKYFQKKNILDAILKDKENSKEKALAFLDALMENLESHILADEERSVKAVEHIETARKYIKMGQSTAYSLKQMCLRV